LRAVLEATAAFSPGEVEVAAELIAGGEDDATPWGYRFTVADDGGAVVGYACYGRSWFTEESWDLYWIAVDPVRQRDGVGGRLLAAAESAALAGSGRMMLVETASKPSYEPARRFYGKHGYVEIARVSDYYADGDDKIVFAKSLTPGAGLPAPAPAVRVADSPGRGRGVFALKAFKDGETIERAPVIPFPAEQWQLFIESVLDDFVFRWGADDEDGAVGLGFASIYNHSFAPNARYVLRIPEQQVEFIAIRDIAAGEEITTNYNRDPDDRKPVWFDPI
jgi:ribosomal protein S18 acetylase RimI-like enzyme